MDIIHILLGKANPERMNGVNKVVFELATYQSLSGRDVCLWGITKDTNINFDYRVFKTRLFKRCRNPFAICKDLQEAIKQTSETTVFHLHGGWIPAYWRIVKLLFKHNRKVVLTTHGAYNRAVVKKSFWKKKLYYYLFESHILKKLNKIHCLGKSEMDGLSALYPNNKSALFPYGYSFMETSDIKMDHSKFVIGFVGRITTFTKGLDILLKAFQKFNQYYPSELWIVGDGVDLNRLRHEIKELGIEDHVILFGSQFGPEKELLLNQMTVFAHPSRNEGLPTAVIEAASHGIPCVVTEATNLAPYIRKHYAGFAIPNENVGALVSAFLKLHNLWVTGKLAPLQKNAVTLVTKDFSWEKLMNKYDQLYSF